MNNIASIKIIKAELAGMTHKELTELIAALLRFKKENKELVTYLLFDSKDENEYIRNVKAEMESGMSEINRFKVKQSLKSIRKVLRNTKKAIRISGKSETEVQILLHFLTLLRKENLPYYRFKALTLIYERVINNIKKAIEELHEDLRYDYTVELEKILE
ncbi:MAG TPA: hypothetical protein VK212_00460 [Lentimicrobium sp.]|nr:hypothetical protein [Lentimicrobium sp.]